MNLIRKFVALSLLTFIVFTHSFAQEEEGGLSISGSVDTYYKYDFSGYPNIPTSFADEQNSVSIGMVNLILSQEVGKVSFVGDVSFGPRGQSASIPNAGADDNSFHIQNLYASYAFSDVVSVTAGYMGTFVGYEIISPVGNFNYSTSYLFTNGPFQNAGIKLDFAISDNFGFMVGLFNDWNVYSDDNGVSDFGAQIYVSPVDGWDAYINFVSGHISGTEIDLTTTYQLTDQFLLGLNVANYTAPDDAGGFFGAALYADYMLTEKFGLGLRYENFQDNEGFVSSLAVPDASVNAFTLSANLIEGPLRIIPEIRIDAASDDIFIDSDAAGTSSAFQALIAAVFSF
jgi:hypothetical protein